MQFRHEIFFLFLRFFFYCKGWSKNQLTNNMELDFLLRLLLKKKKKIFFHIQFQRVCRILKPDSNCARPHQRGYTTLQLSTTIPVWITDGNEATTACFLFAYFRLPIQSHFLFFLMLLLKKNILKNIYMFSTVADRGRLWFGARKTHTHEPRLGINLNATQGLVVRGSLCICICAATLTSVCKKKRDRI